MGKDGGVTFYFSLPLEISIPILSIKKKDRITSRADPTLHIPYVRKIWFSRPKFRPPFGISSRARSSFSHLRAFCIPLFCFVLLCRGDVVATVHNSTRYFGTAAGFSAPEMAKK
jgi:hypothetical protein